MSLPPTPRRRAWSGVVEPPVAGRAQKPREIGLTMVIDKGMGINRLQEFVGMCADYVDMVKFTFGTSALYSESTLTGKIQMLSESGLRVFPGGTFAELALMQGKFGQYLSYARRVGFDAVEISDGSIDLAAGERREAIAAAVDMGFEVITEVGKKHPQDTIPTSQLIELMLADLRAGADYVVVEARESGRKVTIFDAQGNISSEGLNQILDSTSEKQQDRIIWEAPQSAQQKQFILTMGPNVNLGNVAPGEVLSVEALRLGMRGDTLRRYCQRQKRRAEG